MSTRKFHLVLQKTYVKLGTNDVEYIRAIHLDQLTFTAVGAYW